MRSLFIGAAAISITAAAIIAVLAASSGVSAEQLRLTGRGWPACYPDGKQYSGYFMADDKYDTQYFFWYFSAKKLPADAPVYIFLSGGPGCSSSLGALQEMGPCRINATTNEAQPIEDSWSEIAHSIFVDSPSGVGFSYSTKPGGASHDEIEVGDNMYRFLQNFFDAAEFSHLRKNKFFVVAESYGGRYGPSVAYRILIGNQKNEGKHINLQGVSVDNGLSQPSAAFGNPGYPQLAYEWCKVVLGKPCVTEQVYRQMLESVPKCMELTKNCNDTSTNCKEAMEFCTGSLMGPYQETGRNFYDITLTKPFDMQPITNFLNNPEVQKSLGSKPGLRWQMCNMTVNEMFMGDWQHDNGWKIRAMLDAGIRYIQWAGDYDFAVNWIVCQHEADQIAAPWRYGKEFADVKPALWYVDQQPAGTVRTFGTAEKKMFFTFATVHSCSHMCPMQKLKQTTVLMDHFFKDEPFFTYRIRD